MRISLKEQIMIGVAVVVSITIAFGVFLWKPQYDKIGDLKKRQQKEESNYKKQLAELETLKAAKEEAPEVEARSVQLGKKMPEDAEFPSILVEIQEIADESGINFFAIKSEAKQRQKDNYAEIPLEFILKGTFFDLADFLYQVEKMPREIKVDTLAIEVDEEVGYPILSMKLNAEAFIYTPGKVASEEGGG